MNKFQRYHTEFHGDTYEVCARCGGKCEKYKISTLMPGEKEHLSAVLQIPIAELEEKYLSRISLPAGSVEVLKLTDGCRFLDSEFRCGAIAAKPVLCDTYPIVFYKTKGIVHFRIDNQDCPMVHLPEFRQVIRKFQTNGIDALNKFDADPKWWELLVVYDVFDFDFQRIEKELGERCHGSYYLEELLGFACNGYEVRARKKGLDLLRQRVKIDTGKLEQRFPGVNKYSKKLPDQLVRFHYLFFKNQKRSLLSLIGSSKKNADLLGSADNSRYLQIVYESVRMVKQLANGLEHLLTTLNAQERIVVPEKKQPAEKIVPLYPVLPSDEGRKIKGLQHWLD